MIQKKLSEKKRFSIINRARSLTHAWRGIKVYLKGTHNAWVELSIFFVGIVLGFYFQITSVEWILLVLAGFFVIVTEAVNTSIEIDIDLTSPNFHPYAKDTKDVAAGAVLLSAIAGIIIGAIIFIPRIINLFI